MLFTRWWRRDRDPPPGILLDVFVADGAGQPMRRLTAVEALAGRGLAGDRYAAGRGHWLRTDACQVTLVTEADLLRATRRGGIAFARGEHRRNLVVRGLSLEALRGRALRIGEATFTFHRLRPPCGYLDRLLQAPAARALGRGAGVCLRVVAGGWLRVGDPVRVVAEAQSVHGK